MKLKLNDRMSDDEDMDKARENKMKEKKKLKKIQPWSKIVSREKAQSTLKDRDEKPPVGAYHPKSPSFGLGCRRWEKEVNRHKPRASSQIRKKKRKMKLYKKSESFNENLQSDSSRGGRVNQTLNLNHTQRKRGSKLRHLLRRTYHPYQNRIASPIKFNQQIDRKPNVNFSYDSEGKGFKKLTIPKISTKNK